MGNTLYCCLITSIVEIDGVKHRVHTRTDETKYEHEAVTAGKALIASGAACAYRVLFTPRSPGGSTNKWFYTSNVHWMDEAYRALPVYPPATYEKEAASTHSLARSQTTEGR